MAGPSFPNGRAPVSELAEIAPGVPVWWGTANAWARMKAAAAAEAGIDLWPAGIASGYRSLFVQQDMHDRPELYDLNPASSVSLASAGYSTHGWGTRIDIGSAWGPRLTWLLNNAGRFGFAREFGALDPNHFAHDGFTAIEPFSSGGFAGGGITIIMGLSDEKYQGENAKDIPGGGTGFEFLDWGLTAGKNSAGWAKKAYDRIDQLAINIFPWVWRGKLKDAAGKEIGTPESVLAQILTAVQAGGKVNLQLSDADTDLLAQKIAAEVTPGASKDDVEAAVAAAFAKVFVVP